MWGRIGTSLCLYVPAALTRIVIVPFLIWTILSKTLDSALRKLYYIRVDRIGVSSNGRTSDFGSGNWGSNPCTPAV